MRRDFVAPKDTNSVQASWNSLCGHKICSLLRRRRTFHCPTVARPGVVLSVYWSRLPIPAQRSGAATNYEFTEKKHA